MGLGPRVNFSIHAPHGNGYQKNTYANTLTPISSSAQS
jgi:hypothetical protein